MNATTGCLTFQSVYCDSREHTQSFRLYLLAATVLIFALCGRIWISVASTRVGYELAQVRKEIRAVDSERRELELQRSVLLKRTTLEQLATERLGLTRSKTDQIYQIQGRD